MIELFFVLTFFIALFAWVNAKKRNALYWSDLCSPFVLPTFWFLVTASGYGHQSLSHLIELPIVVLFSVLFLNVRVFILDRYRKNYKLNSLIVLCFGFLFVLLLRTFMPFLPE